MLQDGLQRLEISVFQALCNLLNHSWVKCSLKYRHINWLIYGMKNANAGLHCELSNCLRELVGYVLQHNGKDAFAVGSETLAKILRNLVKQLESSDLTFKGASIHRNLLLTLETLKLQSNTGLVIILGRRIISTG
jgi:hypothetical protein